MWGDACLLGECLCGVCAATVSWQTLQEHVDEFHWDPMIPVESTKIVLLQYY